MVREEVKQRGWKREGERERERRHIDVHAFRLVHICNANLRGDRETRGRGLGDGEQRRVKWTRGKGGEGDRADRKGRA